MLIPYNIQIDKVSTFHLNKILQHNIFVTIFQMKLVIANSITILLIIKPTAGSIFVRIVVLRATPNYLRNPLAQPGYERKH